MIKVNRVSIKSNKTLGTKCVSRQKASDPTSPVLSQLRDQNQKRILSEDQFNLDSHPVYAHSIPTQIPLMFTLFRISLDAKY